jgi:AmiR/NasT family two-component response regulator
MDLLGRTERQDPPEPIAPTLEELVAQVEHLHRALASRDVIGQAKGILMERLKLSADEAFHLLVQRSQHENVKVAELAAALAETGEWEWSPPGRVRPR